MGSKNLQRQRQSGRLYHQVSREESPDEESHYKTCSGTQNWELLHSQTLDHSTTEDETPEAMQTHQQSLKIETFNTIRSMVHKNRQKNRIAKKDQSRYRFFGVGMRTIRYRGWRRRRRRRSIPSQSGPFPRTLIDDPMREFNVPVSFQDHRDRARFLTMQTALH